MIRQVSRLASHGSETPHDAVADAPATQRFMERLWKSIAPGVQSIAPAQLTDPSDIEAVSFHAFDEVFNFTNRLGRICSHAPAGAGPA